MECRHCGIELKGNFCHKCGAVAQPAEVLPEIADAAERPEVNAMPAADSAAAERQEPAAVEELQDNAAYEAEKAAVRPKIKGLGIHALISLVAAAAISLLLMVGVSAGLNWMADRERFTADLGYHVMKNAIHMPVDQAAYFADQLTEGIWLQLLLLQSGAIAGEYTVAAQGLISEGSTYYYQLHIPLVFHTLLGLAIIYGGVRLLRPYVKHHIHTDLQRLLWIAAFSLVFSCFMTLVTLFTGVKLQYVLGEQLYTFKLSIVAWKHALTLFVVGLLASAVGIGGWSLFTSKGWSTWARSMRSFLIIMVSLGLLISGLMIVNWSIAGKHRLHSTEVITLGAVWDAYKTDPSFYAVMPNAVVQEFIYSIGGTWQVAGQHNADWLGLDGPVKLNLLTGAKALVPEGEELAADDKERFKELDNDIRMKWFHAAFMLTFLYALSRIRFSRVMDYLASIFGVMMITSAAAIYFNITINIVEGEPAFVGFEPLQVLLALTIFVGASLTVSYGVQYLWAARGRRDAKA